MSDPYRDAPVDERLDNALRDRDAQQHRAAAWKRRFIAVCAGWLTLAFWMLINPGHTNVRNTTLDALFSQLDRDAKEIQKATDGWRECLNDADDYRKRMRRWQDAVTLCARTVSDIVTECKR